MPQVLSNEMWREVVAFIPLEKIVSTDYSSPMDVIASYKLERYLKLQGRRNSVLDAIFSLWLTSCSLRDDFRQTPIAEHGRIKKERKDLKEKIFAELSVLFLLFDLPWPYQKIVSVGVSYRSSLHISLYLKVFYL